MKFKVIFTFDPEYEGYVAEVPELPGCLSQGKTLDEAIGNIKDAIQGYLYVQEKHGKLEKIMEDIGAWEDDRTDEEIIKEIYESRSFSNRGML
ncbi:type II toxin-antitoxin system HicB family antitoxin [Aerosakkonemataceae cyanobacterium BLCC-F154]|uniref:Type II toxin-antitoxin system HicB family antitoxin n=1 Tax=Floridaenema fluviatile BLCC-F154 TaxID=3153640 RepID=A0ABV4Y4U2_9CYAN